MVNSLENIDKSKVYVDRIEGLDEVVEDVISDTLVGAVSTITTSDLTSNKILVSDANGKVAASNKAITDIGGDGDNLSITKNASDKLQTVGVINQNNTTIAIKTWTGTLAEYNTIVSKDSNTLYNITDDMQASTYEAYSKSETDTLLSTLLTNLYPVGSIYITTANTCPLSVLINGSTWTKIEDKFLLSSGTKNVNETGGSETNTLTMGNMPDRVVKMINNSTGSDKSGYSMMSCQELGNKVVQANNWGHVDSIDGLGYGMESSDLANYQPINNMPPYIVVNIWQRTA